MWLSKLAAASVALLLLYSGYKWFNVPKAVTQVPALSSVYGDDVLAGGNKASLTLADGHTYDTDTPLPKSNLSEPDRHRKSINRKGRSSTDNHRAGMKRSHSMC